MKKTYQNPTTEIINAQPSVILAGSNPDGFNGNLNTTAGNGSNALGRRDRDDFWDDEEDY